MGREGNARRRGGASRGDLARELVGAERLLEQPARVDQLAPALHRLGRVARDEEHPEGRAHRHQLLRKRGSAQARHDHIGNQEIDGLVRRAGEDERRLGVGRFQHPIALGAGAAPELFGGKERLEQVGEHMLVHADPRVLHREDDQGAGR
jgi:hypothetical protein